MMKNFANIIESAQQNKILIVVHPGSACGSADFNLGRSGAQGERSYLANDIAQWRDGVIVVDGALSDELPRYGELNQAIVGVLDRANQKGLLSIRVFACDDETPDWTNVVGTKVLEHIPRDASLELTGAWYFQDDSAGCVNAVYDEAKKLGFHNLTVRDSAITDPSGDGDEDEDFERELDESVAGPIAVLTDPRVKHGVKIGANARLWRGEDDEGSGFASYGLGYYFTTDRAYAKKFGRVVEVSKTSLPDHALRFDSVNDFQIWLGQTMKVLGIADKRDIGKQYPDFANFIRSLDPEIDGLQIGSIFVLYP